MKNNKGFTLVELLAIVVILALIILVAAPSMTNQIKKKESTDQTILDEKIYNASRMYAAKYYADDIVNNGSFEFTLKDLEEDGLLDLKGKCIDPNTSKLYGGSISWDSADNKLKFDDNIKKGNCASDNIGS